MSEIALANPMTNTQSKPIEPEIRDFIARNLLYSSDGFPYEDEASLLREGIIDSLGIVELVEFVQKQFGLKVDQQEVVPENFDSVARLASYVRRKQQNAQAS
jgi:acyl carrier protein